MVLLNDGFPAAGSAQERYYKPGGVYFEACSKGRLLLMEPHAAAFTMPAIQAAVEETLGAKGRSEALQLRRRSCVIAKVSLCGAE